MQKGLPDFLVLYQDNVGWSLGIIDRKNITLQIRYGGFQLTFQNQPNTFPEYLGFRGPVPSIGPTSCADASKKPIFEVGCYPCISNFSTTAEMQALSLLSR
jgi:hypothetical protein